MLRFILGALLVLISLRILVSIGRLIAAGRRREVRDRVKPETPPLGPRVDKSSAIDVPFKELPPDSP